MSFETDWNQKKNIVKSILKNLLSKTNQKISRKCSVQELTSDQKANLLSYNDIHGNDESMVRLGPCLQSRIGDDHDICQK